MGYVGVVTQLLTFDPSTSNGTSKIGRAGPRVVVFSATAVGLVSEKNITLLKSLAKDGAKYRY